MNYRELNRADCEQGDKNLIYITKLRRPTAAPASTRTPNSIDDLLADMADDTAYLICRGIALALFVVSMIFYACL